MKNLVKVLGIIAVIAIVGLAVGCSVDPDDATRIQITDIPEVFEGKYAIVVVLEDSKEDSKWLGATKVGKKITGGVSDANPLFEVDMENETFKDLVIVKKGYVALFIQDSEKLGEDLGDLYKGITVSLVNLGEGTIPIKASEFTPDISKYTSSSNTPVAEEKVASFKGTYKASYKSAGTVAADDTIETINLTDVEKFIISDAKSSAPGTVVDKLEFKIESWDYADTPSTYATDYPNAFKFKGRITSSTTGYYGTNSQTGKGIVATDIKADGSGTECLMYLYFSNTGKVIRTPFSKVGGTENKDVVMYWTATTSYPNPPLRVYTKQ